jgi:predicted nucleic acid-binding protein
VTCHEQIEEIRQASRYEKFSGILQPHRVGLMLNNMRSSTVIENLPSSLDYETADPNDSWLLALADKSQAHYLVTGDKKAGILARFRFGQTQIVTASAFCSKVF